MTGFIWLETVVFEPHLANRLDPDWTRKVYDSGVAETKTEMANPAPPPPKPRWSASQEESWQLFEQDVKSRPVFCICVKRFLGKGGGVGKVERIDVLVEIPSDRKALWQAHCEVVHEWRRTNLVTVESTVGPILRPASGLMGTPVQWRATWKAPWPCPCPPCVKQRRQNGFKVILPDWPGDPAPRTASVPVVEIDDDDDIEEFD
jgi:hypothetical protein